MVKDGEKNGYLVGKELVILLFMIVCCNIFVMFYTVHSFPPGIWGGILNLTVKSLCLRFLLRWGLTKARLSFTSEDGHGLKISNLLRKSVYYHQNLRLL